jgi:hypothetical protein
MGTPIPIGCALVGISNTIHVVAEKPGDNRVVGLASP